MTPSQNRAIVPTITHVEPPVIRVHHRQSQSPRSSMSTHVDSGRLLPRLLPRCPRPSIA